MGGLGYMSVRRDMAWPKYWMIGPNLLAGTKLRLVAAGKEFDPHLRVVRFLVIVLSDALANLCDRDPDDGVRCGVVICRTIKDMDAQQALL